jgi:hypothetical protein
VVGRNSTAISVMLFLAGVAELNLMSTLVRFLPTSGKRTTRLIVSIYAASAAVAALLGLGFLLIIPVMEPEAGQSRSMRGLGRAGGRGWRPRRGLVRSISV